MGIQLILQFTNAYKCAHGIKYSIRGNILKVFGHSFGLLCWYSCNQSGFFWSLFFIVQNEFCAFGLFIRLDELSARSVGRRSIGCSFAVCVTLVFQCFNSEFIFLRKRAYAASIWYSFLFYSLSSPFHSLARSLVGSLHLFHSLSFKLIDILECAPTI